MKITSKTNICIIIGDPIENSLSPQMHNAGYVASGLDGKFVFISAKAEEKDLNGAIEGIRSLGIRGVTVTHPHKIKVMTLVDEIDSVARKIGAVNTIVNNNGKLTGYNTDCIGVQLALEEKISINGKTVAVLGAGGASCAATFGVIEKGAKVTIFNRTLVHAKSLATDFKCEFRSLDNLEEVKNMDIIINATTIGMNEDRSPIDKKFLNSKQIVFDAVYSPFETMLLRDAKSIGATIIHGTEMLLFQGAAQFELFTGKKAPINAMRKAIMKGLKYEN